MELRLLAALAFSGIATPHCHAAEIVGEARKDGGALIFISGEIVAGDDATFRELSVRYPEALVGLDSGGGSITPALEIGRLIRLRGYGTAVTSDSKCTSACALIWLAGTPRFLQPGGRLGFHASYRDEGGKLVETGLGNAIIGHYLSQLNLSQRAVVFATSASPYEISWLTPANKLSSGIDFSEVPGDDEPPRPPPPVYIPPPVKSSKISSSPPTVTKLKPGEIERYLRKTFASPSYANSLAAKFNVSASQRKIIADHAFQLYSNGDMLSRLATEMESVGDALTGPQGWQVGYEIGAGLTEKLLLRGLMRLPNSDVKQYLGHMAMIPLDATTAECGDVFWPKDSKTATLEFEIVGRQGDEALRDYLAIMRKAVAAEIAQSPSAIKLTSAQSEAADSAFAKSFDDLTSVLSDDEKARAFATLDNMDAANTASKCDAMILILSSAVRMPGLTGDWFRRKFIEGMAE